MKRFGFLFWVAGLLVLLGLTAYRRHQLALDPDRARLQVGLVTDGEDVPEAEQVRDAYGAVLQEEGVSFAWFEARDLLPRSPADLMRLAPVLILPDTVARRVPMDLLGRLWQYVEAGGIVLVVRDAGALTTAGRIRAHGVFSELAGVDYSVEALRGEPERQGPIRFMSQQDADFWQITPGKLTKKLEVSSYMYGALTYTVSTAHTRNPGPQVFAECRGSPVLTRMRRGAGQVFWCGTPLGNLKSRGDDMMMRVALRTVVFDAGQVAHLVNAPGGEGGMVMAWHIDANAEHPNLPLMLRDNFFRRKLHVEFDVTAGPDCYRAGDGEGFDAVGKGRALLTALKPFGDVGSHGGWAHDWFAHGLEQGRFTEAEIEDAVRKNSAALTEVTGQPVLSYAAPSGVHPQPSMTRLLEKLGIVTYYYTGDTGSAPTRAFFNGKMASSTVWAFPIVPCGVYASLYEMHKAGLPPAEVDRWLQSLLDYVAHERVVRLVYSHPHDVFDTVVYKEPLKRFFDRLEAMQERHEARSESMVYFARFMQRFVSTRSRLVEERGSLSVMLENPTSLRSICVAVPRSHVDPHLSLPTGLSSTMDATWVYITVDDDRQSLHLSIPLARGRETPLAAPSSVASPSGSAAPLSVGTPAASAAPSAPAADSPTPSSVGTPVTSTAPSAPAADSPAPSSPGIPAASAAPSAGGTAVASPAPSSPSSIPASSGGRPTGRISP